MFVRAFRCDLDLWSKWTQKGKWRVDCRYEPAYCEPNLFKRHNCLSLIHFSRPSQDTEPRSNLDTALLSL